MLAHVIEHFFHRPAGIDCDQVRRHQSAHAAFRITEQGLGDVSFFRRQQLDQLSRGGARQFLQQRRPIVRRHFIQDPDDLFVRHRAQEFLLRFDLEVFEDVGREVMRQQAEDDDLFFLGKIGDDFRDIGRRPFRKHLAQRGEVPRVDQASNFRLENFPDHDDDEVKGSTARRRA